MNDCPLPSECEGRLSTLEVLLEETKRTADRAAADVVRIERDVDRIGSEMRRLRAVMVGSDEEENGGLRAEVQWMRSAVEESRRYQRWMFWMLAALVGVLSPEQLVKLADAVRRLVGQ